MDDDPSDTDSSVYHSATDINSAETASLNDKYEQYFEAPPFETNLDDFKNYETYSQYLSITKLNLFIPCVSLVLYLTDVVSDQVLAIKYGMEEEWMYSGLTLVFVLLPALYLSLFVGTNWKEIVKKDWKWWCLLIPLVVFNLEPAIQYVKNFIIAKKYLKGKREGNVPKQVKYYNMYVNGSRNVSNLKYAEALMEAVPQLTLQGYILLRNFGNIQWNDKFFIQMASLSTSIIGIALIIFIRHKVFWLANGKFITPFGRSLWTCGRFFSLISRIICITTSASLYPTYTLSALGLHWFLAAVWRYCTDLKTLGYIEPIFQGAADTMVPRVDSLINNVLSHSIIRIEDIAMMIVWYFHAGNEFDHMKLIFVVFFLILDVCGGIADVSYKMYSDRFTINI